MTGIEVAKNELPEDALDIFSEFATDEQLEDQGAWQTLKGSTKLLVARANNRAYGRLLSELVEKHSEQLNNGTPEADALSDKLMVQVIAKTVLKGWENLVYKGKALAYNTANAEMVLSHADFRRRVLELANNREAYKAKLEVEQGEA
jgi:hypothetical protein